MICASAYHAIDEIAVTVDLSEDKSIPVSGDRIDVFCGRQHWSLMSKAKFVGYFCYPAMFPSNRRQVHCDGVEIASFDVASKCPSSVADQCHCSLNADSSTIASMQIKRSRRYDGDYPLKYCWLPIPLVGSALDRHQSFQSRIKDTAAAMHVAV